MSIGKLYLVPTPIGNLSDMTDHAREVLASADIVACEDTRTSGRLMQHLGLKKKLVSYHEFNERSRSAQLIERIRAGETVAVISDAGSPGISDPAYRVVRAAIEADIEIIPLPGPNALIPALTASGLPTDRFFFEGFLSHKTGARKRRLEAISSYPHTLIFYESPFRIHKTLQAIFDVLGDRPACLSREISKKFEEHVRGTVSEILNQIKGKAVKGEMVLCVGGLGDAREPDEPDAEAEDT